MDWLLEFLSEEVSSLSFCGNLISGQGWSWHGEPGPTGRRELEVGVHGSPLLLTVCAPSLYSRLLRAQPILLLSHLLAFFQ